MVMDRVIIGIIFVVIGLVFLLALAPTVSDSTQTGSGQALENVSSTAKTVYGLYDLVYSAGGLVFLALGIFSIATGVGKRK